MSEETPTDEQARKAIKQTLRNVSDVADILLREDPDLRSFESECLLLLMRDVLSYLDFMRTVEDAVVEKKEGLGAIEFGEPGVFFATRFGAQLGLKREEGDINIKLRREIEEIINAESSK